jgi:DNA-directed RNA polymerase subunit M/transcription elongation factor TFIIS
VSTTEEASVVNALLADPKLERLLTIAKEINDLLVKITAASDYLASPKGTGDFEEVEIARTQLSRDLARDYSEAEELLPSLDETVAKLEEQARDLANARKMSIGLARIEGLSGTGKQKRFLDDAESAQAKISETENLIGALEALQGDLSSRRRTPHSCPRCSSANVRYRLTPSELGFTIYKCESCDNAWRITSFTLRSA